MNDLDDVLKELGQFGNYQILMYLMLFLPLFLSSASSMTYVFTTSDTSYRCLVPQCENDSQAYNQPWLHDALPFNDDGSLAGQCLKYKPKSNNSKICLNDSFSMEVEECDKFVFETDENTMATEFNLLCDGNKWKRTLVGTLINIGLFVGMPLTSIISDRFGRKKMLLGSLLLSAVFGTIRSFTRNYYQYLAMEVFDAISYSSIYSGVYVYGIEIIGPDMRGLGGAILSIFYPLGEILLGITVWFVHDWRAYLRILYTPAFLFIIYIWILPESIRWSLAHGKTRQATNEIERLSKLNRKKITSNLKKTIEHLCYNDTNEVLDVKNQPSEKEKTQSPMRQVLSSRIMLFRVLNCSFCWMTHTFVFYGLSLNSVSIAGNKYLNFILASFAEIPGSFLCTVMVNYCGRKLSLFLGLVVSGAACISFHFIPLDSTNIKMALYFLGKLAITESFSGLYILASEIYPTDMRHSLLGFCSTMGRIGSMLAPQAPLIASYIDPMLIFGGLSLIAGALSLGFPETKNSAMPSTMKEAEELGKKKSGISQSMQIVHSQMELQPIVENQPLLINQSPDKKQNSASMKHHAQI